MLEIMYYEYLNLMNYYLIVTENISKKPLSWGSCWREK